MSLMENSGTLSRAAKDLFARWNDVNAIWNDTQSEEFEKSCLEPLRQDIRAALGAMEHMNAILQTIQSDCE